MGIYFTILSVVVWGFCLRAERNITVKRKKFKLFLSILAVTACILFGCEKKEKVSLSDLKPVEEEEALPPENEQGTKETQDVTDLIVVHICGAVVNPGVYELPAGSRTYQAIQAADGFLEGARQDFLNQAAVLQDGIRLYVPTEEEAAEALWEDEGLVNINTADEEELCTLTGIGSSKARSIIAYRTRNGNFQKTEDIMNVEGIKDGLFQKIKDSITV